MIKDAPIKIHVTDDPKNPPEVDKVAKEFNLKVPRNCELGEIKVRLIQEYPILQYMISVLYFFNTGKCYLG